MTHFRPEPFWQQNQGVAADGINLDPLAVIYNEGQWRLNKVSPMYNVQYDAVKLKQYGSKIRQAIVGNVTASSSLKYTVKVEAEAQLKFSEEDAHGLMITVLSTNEGDRKTKVAYSAVLLSWGVFTTLKDSIHLPYMLERGEQKIGGAVKSTLQSLFDCNINQVSFAQHHLLQFGFNFLEHDMSRQTDTLSLVYKTPQVDDEDKLTIAFEMGDVRTILNRAKEIATKPTESLNITYQLIQEQIFHMVTLDVSVFNLDEVIMPRAQVKTSGIVRMKTPELVHSFFSVLNKISINS